MSMTLADIILALRHLYVYMYFLLKLYILGVCEMLQQPFKSVHSLIDDTTEDMLRGKTLICTGGTSGIGKIAFAVLCS